MISNQLTTIKGLSNKELTKLDSGKFQTKKVFVLKWNKQNKTRRMAIIDSNNAVTNENKWSCL
jgi:hypothetical protein